MIESVQSVLLSSALKSMQAAQQDIELLIMATPTGDRRNRMCDMNIHLCQAIATSKALLPPPPTTMLFEARNAAR